MHHQVFNANFVRQDVKLAPLELMRLADCAIRIEFCILARAARVGPRNSREVLKSTARNFDAQYLFKLMRKLKLQRKFSDGGSEGRTQSSS